MWGLCYLLPVFVSFAQHVSMNVGSLLFVTCICFFHTTCFNKCGVFIVCYLCLFLLQSICQWIWGSLLFVTCVCFLYRACVTRCGILFFCLFLYLYSAQCLHILQDSKCCITHSTVQMQSYFQITDIYPLCLSHVFLCVTDHMPVEKGPSYLLPVLVTFTEHMFIMEDSSCLLPVFLSPQSICKWRRVLFVSLCNHADLCWTSTLLHGDGFGAVCVPWTY